jgi:hypothetical protein
MEEYDGAGWRTGTRFVDISGHIATAGSGEYCVDFVRLSASEKKANEAQKDADDGSKYCAAIQLWNDDIGGHGCARRRLDTGKGTIPGA